jgi:hypothetical protein
VRIAGRHHYLGKYDSPESRERYHRLLAYWNANGTATNATRSNDLSINELCLAFFQHAENYYRRHDGETTGDVENLRLAIRPLEKLYGLKLARDFGPKALKAVRQFMIDGGLARRTINQRIARINRLFRYGVENELIPANIHHALKAVTSLKRGRSGAKESKPFRPVSDAHVDAVKPFVSRQVWAMIELQEMCRMLSDPDAFSSKFGRDLLHWRDFAQRKLNSTIRTFAYVRHFEASSFERTLERLRIAS